MLPYEDVMTRPGATHVCSIILDHDSVIHRVLSGLHSDILELCSSQMTLTPIGIGLSFLPTVTKPREQLARWRHSRHTFEMPWLAA